MGRVYRADHLQLDAQVAVYRTATSEFFVRGDQGDVTRIQWGRRGDIPVPADYDGTGRLRIAVYRPGTGEWFLRPDTGAAVVVHEHLDGRISIHYGPHRIAEYAADQLPAAAPRRRGTPRPPMGQAA